MGKSRLFGYKARLCLRHRCKGFYLVFNSRLLNCVFVLNSIEGAKIRRFGWTLGVGRLSHRLLLMGVLSSIHIANSLRWQLVFNVPWWGLHFVHVEIPSVYVRWQEGAVLVLLKRVVPLGVANLDTGLLAAFSLLSQIERWVYRTSRLKLLCWYCSAASSD